MRRLSLLAITALAVTAIAGTPAITSQAAAKTIIIGGGGFPEFSFPDMSMPSEPEIENSQNPYAQQVVSLVNRERAKAGLQPLAVSTQITSAANVRAKEIETSFSHNRPDGSSFSTALTQSGAVFRGAGENIAYGQRTPEEVMNGWMNSAGHRANILNKDFTTIGVGYRQNSKGIGYWVQLFTY